MNIIPTQELKDFILSQPDDRQISMSEVYPSNPCGCILLQFQSAKRLPPAPVGYTVVGEGYEFPKEVSGFIARALDHNIINYKQAKALLAEILP